MNTIFQHDIRELAETIIPAPDGITALVWQISAREVLVGIHTACRHYGTMTDGAFWKALSILNQSDEMANSLLSVIHKCCSQYFSQQFYAKRIQPGC